MAYADREYYYNVYCGSEIDEEEIDGLLEKAGRIIDLLTGYRITKTGLDFLGEYRSTLVKSAVCAEADHLERNGDNTEPAEMTLGSFRYVNSDSESGGKYSPEALVMLDAAGLMGRKVSVI